MTRTEHPNGAVEFTWRAPWGEYVSPATWRLEVQSDGGVLLGVLPSGGQERTTGLCPVAGREIAEALLARLGAP